MSKAEGLSEEEIDQLVIAQADDDSAWEEPIHVGKSKSSATVRSNMMKVDQRVLGRLQELITVGEQVLSTRTPPPPQNGSNVPSSICR